MANSSDCTCTHPWGMHEFGGIDYYCAMEGCDCPSYSIGHPANDAIGELREIYKRIEDEAVRKFCAELLALDAGPSGHGKWPSDGRHSNGSRLVRLIEAIEARTAA